MPKLAEITKKHAITWEDIIASDDASRKSIKSIETIWHGHRFRSRLEARWAVVFECLGIDWEYEPEGFEFQDGTKYLPDFLLHGIVGRNGYMPPAPDDEDSGKFFGDMGLAADRGDNTDGDLYIEVKGHWRNKEERRKVMLLSEHVPVYVVGDIPMGKYWTIEDGCSDWYCDMEYACYEGSTPYYYNFETVDNDHFGAFLGVDVFGRPGLFGDDSNYLRDAWDYPTAFAYATAKYARFEHGEHPNETEIKRCRDMVMWARNNHADVEDEMSRIIGEMDEDEIETLKSIADILTELKNKHGLTNIYVEAFDDSRKQTAVYVRTNKTFYPYGFMRICGGHTDNEDFPYSMGRIFNQSYLHNYKAEIEKQEKDADYFRKVDGGII